MQDRPTSGELAQAILEFLKEEILPTATDRRLRFRTLVAMNGLGMLARELEHEESLLGEEYRRLCALLGEPEKSIRSLAGLRQRVLESNRTLSRNIRKGEVPAGLSEHLERTVREKLLVANPRYLKDGS